MLEVSIKGAGEVAIALVDRKGQVLFRKRLIISGAEGIEAKSRVPLQLETKSGRIPVVPVLIRKTTSQQEVLFGGRDPESFATTRCRELKFPKSIVERVVADDRTRDERAGIVLTNRRKGLRKR